ncbi:uncharacterized protein LOC142632953 [Castanea sativa]|uniref:uncharacterized protein LOC142632953 n=1 Tax=Castanea sativa TaxID=21020 RepID=UPI003F64B8A5
MDLPWLYLGDFNEIVKVEEKLGGSLRRERQMTNFRAALDFCGLRDLGYVGFPFTWCNNQFDGEVCSNDENVRFYKKGRPFQFEAVWMKDKSCEGVIKNAWNGTSLGNPMEILVRKVDSCRSSLQTWSKLSFGNIR